MSQVLSVKKPSVKDIQILTFSIILISFDQASKLLIIKLFPHLLILNQKGMWGIVPAWVGILALLFFGYLLFKQKQDNLVYWLIFSAGLSNLIDRIVYNGVIDWIYTFSWFPVFNLADMVITGGVIILLLRELFSNKFEI